MTWVKQNYDRFLLALLAAALLGCAGLLFNNARNFNLVFASLKDQVPRSNKFQTVNQDDVAKQQKQLADPDIWQARMVANLRLPLFVSPPYIASGDQLINPLDSGSNMLHPPIPNAWLLEHNQDLLSPNVLDQDGDGDGFTTPRRISGQDGPAGQELASPVLHETGADQVRAHPVPFAVRRQERRLHPDQYGGRGRRAHPVPESRSSGHRHQIQDHQIRGENRQG